MKANKKTGIKYEANEPVRQTAPVIPNDKINGMDISNLHYSRTTKLSTTIVVGAAMLVVGAVYGAASAENGTGLAEVVKFGGPPAYVTTAVPITAAPTSSASSATGNMRSTNPSNPTSGKHDLSK